MYVFNEIIDSLQFIFIQKALISGILIALSCSLIGPFLVLRNLSLIGDGLAHVSFATMAIALVLGQSPMLISIPIVILSSFMILKINEKTSIDGDAAIGLVSSLAISIGVIIGSISEGFNVDLFSFLFGSILIINTSEIIMSLVLTVILIGGIIVFYSELFTITYDEDFARSQRIKVDKFNKLLIIFTSVTIVLGIRVVGTMLISSLIIFPSVCAIQVAKGFKSMMVYSCIFSIISVIFGIFTSYILDIPTGATIVLVNGVIFVMCFAKKKLF